MGLEELVNKFSENVAKPVRNGIRHICAWPKCLGITAAFAAHYKLAEMQAPVETSVHVFGIGFGAYYLAGLVNEYVFPKKKKKKDKQNQGLVQRIKEFVLDNPKLFAPAWGFSAAGIVHNLPRVDLSFSESLSLFGPPFYVLASAFLQCAKHNDLFKNAYDYSRSDSVAAKVPDFVLEHPGSIAAVSGAASLAYLLNISMSFDKMQPVGFSILAYVPLSAGMAVYAFSVFAAGFVHSSMYLRFARDIKISFLSVFRRHSALESCINGILKKPLPPAEKMKYHLKLADIFISEDKADYSLLHVKNALLFSQEDIKDSSPYYCMKRVLGLEDISFFINDFIFGFSSEPKRSLYYAAASLVDKDFDQGVVHLDRAVETSGNDLRFKIIRASYLDILGRDSAGAWGDVVSRVIEEYEGRFEQVSFTSKEVLTLSFDAYLQDSFIFARSAAQGSLEGEHNLTSYVFSCFDDKSCVPMPYYFAKGQNGLDYSVCSRLRGCTLAGADITGQDLLDSLGLYFDFCLRATACKESMGSFSADIPSPGYEAVFDEKFLRRMPFDKAKKEKLKKLFFPVISLLGKKPRHFVHGNLHPGNIIKGSGRYGLIDFGDACFANICTGIEQLLGHDLVNADKARVYSAVYDFSGGISKDEFLEDCAISSAFVAAHLLGRSVYYNEGSAGHYKNNLADSVAFLAENFFSGREKSGLLDFADVIQCSDVK